MRLICGTELPAGGELDYLVVLVWMSLHLLSLAGRTLCYAALYAAVGLKVGWIGVKKTKCGEMYE